MCNTFSYPDPSWYNSNMRNKSFVRGFTLIEILVVITIISILSGILYATFGTAKEDTRNKTVKTELKEVQLALELYKAQYGRYPAAPTSPTSGGPSACVINAGSGVYYARSKFCAVTDPYIKAITPEFIAELPSHKTSANPNCNIIYVTDNDDNSWYKLTAENCHAGATNQTEGVQPDDEFARCPSTCAAATPCISTDADFYNSYAVYSKGGECY